MIPQERIETAAHEYIASGFNTTQAYLAAHPSSTKETAHGNASKFIDYHGVRERALEILNSSKKLSASAVLKSFEESLEAKSGVWYRGERIGEEPEHSIRLETKKYLCKLHGLENAAVNIDNRSVNVNVQAQDNSILNEMIAKLDQIAKKCSNTAPMRAEADAL